MLSSEISKSGKVTNKYKDFPTNSFHNPIWYRVVNSKSPAEFEGNVRARLYPPPALDALDKDAMHQYLGKHGNKYNRDPTPFISITNDLLRAFSIAFRSQAENEEVEDVAIILISSRLLAKGSYVKCGGFRCKCGFVQDPKYNTEILVWGEIPARSILHRWPLLKIRESGLFNIFPSFKLPVPNWETSSLRLRIKTDVIPLSPSEIATALVRLGMDPRGFEMKQVFIFLIGKTKGWKVEQDMDKTEARKEAAKTEPDREAEKQFRKQIEEFDKAAYKLSVSNWERTWALYRDDSYAVFMEHNHVPKSDDEEKWMLAAESQKDDMKNMLCPSFKSWWLQRELQAFYEREMQKKMPRAVQSNLDEWLQSQKQTISFIEIDGTE